MDHMTETAEITTVGGLIEALKLFDPSLAVSAFDRDGGFCTVYVEDNDDSPYGHVVSICAERWLGSLMKRVP